MAGERLEFPKGFVWGTSTAGHQIEGHNSHSDWWRFEHEGKIKDGTVSGKCMDYWNRYEEDHDLMTTLGYKAFRLGIEWAKIEPDDGRIDRAAIERYKKILQSLRDHNLQICLTLYHWVLPLWFADKGGWLWEDAVARFMKFTEIAVNEFAEFPDLWVTLNEPLVPAAAGYLAGEFPPEKKSIKFYGKVTGKLLRAHALNYELIHKTVKKG
ncbi:MAG TPA: family 1 glycosylhydrolase, partial [bacterium]|nr:family 1 glycosylhydrolase [bacterium]